MIDSERNAVRKIYALPETCKVGDLVAAFEMNPCKRAKDFIVQAVQALAYPYELPRDPEIREFYKKIRDTQCKH